MDEAVRKKTIFSWVLIAVLFLLLIFGISRLFARKTPASKTTPPKAGSTSSVSVIQKSAASVAPGGGSLKLSTQGASGVVAVGEPALIRAVASSGGTPVVGYDIVISFDPSALSFQSASQTLGDYAGSAHAAPGKLTVSGFLKKQETKPRILLDTIIAEIQFKPLKTGKTMVTVSYAPGATDESNLMSEGARDILSQVTPLALNVGTPVQLRPGETKAIDKGPYALRLDKITVPPSTCRDCFTSQDLTLLNTQTSAAAPFGFRSGGFAGTIHDEIKQGGYLFKLDQSGTAAITVIVAHE